MRFSKECGSKECFNGAKPLCFDCEKKKKELSTYEIYSALRKLHEDCIRRGYGDMARMWKNGFYLRLIRVGIGIYSLGIKDSTYPKRICIRKRYGKYDFSKFIRVAKEVKDWINNEKQGAKNGTNILR